MSKKKVPFKVFGNNPDAPIPPDILVHTPAMKAVDDMFLAEARTALAAAGCSALEFLAENPLVSRIELTKRLAKRSGCTTRAIGLTMAVYAEAVGANSVRAVAKDLLLRTILQKFPDGWFWERDICASVKFGGWDSDIASYVSDKSAGNAAFQIVKHLTNDDPPPDGWKPESPSDPRIDALFDRFWPTGKPNK